MEIERKYLIRALPDDYASFPQILLSVSAKLMMIIF